MLFYVAGSGHWLSWRQAPLRCYRWLSHEGLQSARAGQQSWCFFDVSLHWSVGPCGYVYFVSVKMVLRNYGRGKSAAEKKKERDEIQAIWCSLWDLGVTLKASDICPCDRVDVTSLMSSYHKVWQSNQLSYRDVPYKKNCVKNWISCTAWRAIPSVNDIIVEKLVVG